MALFEGAAEKIIDEDKLGANAAQLLSHAVFLLERLIDSLGARKRLRITIEVEDKPPLPDQRARPG